MPPRHLGAIALGASALLALATSWSPSQAERPPAARHPMVVPRAQQERAQEAAEEPPEPEALLGATAPDLAPARPPEAPLPSEGLPLPPRRATPVATPSLAQTENILVVGVDRRPGSGPRGGRPDTLLVVVLDQASSHVGLISVPRDLYVSLPGHGPARINAAYGLARRLGQPPLALLRAVVEDTLALPIAHSVELDLGGFEALIDAVGGVAVEVPCPIVDRFVDPRAEGGRRLLSVAAGLQQLDGATAAMYVRSRHGRSDFSRARRQQAVALGLRRRLGEPATLARLPALIRAALDMVQTDLGLLELASLARRASRLDPSHLHGFVFGAKEAAPSRTAEGRAVLLPRYEAIDAALARLFEAPPPGTRQTRRACPAPDVALAPR